MPLIRQKLQQLFGKEPNKRVHPDEAVALGAALLADSFGKIDSVVLIDVLPMSIGIGTHGGSFQPVLEAGVPLPATKTFRMRTYREQQDFMEVAVFQGNSKRVVDNEYLGTIFISEVTPAGKGEVRLDITLSLDQEGLLQVSSRESDSGKENPTKMAMKDSQESLRLMLGIPKDEVCQEDIGVPVSLKWRQETEGPPDED
jgi:molecular chaperone DnaK